MPAPQPGTAAAVVFTDLQTGARFGIEGHSVRALAELVKNTSGCFHVPAAGPVRPVRPPRRASSSSTAAGSSPRAANST